MSAHAEIPLFPLHTVLFPGGLLPLRIFETRYLDMVSRCLADQAPFGICLIRQGREVGEAAECFDVGTEGRIVDFATLPGGLLGVSVEGGRRFRVLSRQVQPDQLLVAHVEWLAEADTGATTLPPALRSLMEAAVEAGLLAPADPGRLDDPGWVSYRAAELLDAPAALRQTLLESEDLGRRVELLVDLASRLAAASQGRGP